MGIGFRELVIILVIALLVFGTKKLKNIGSDLGGAVKGFKDAMQDGEKKEDAKQLDAPDSKDADFSTTADKADSKKV
ncbi:MAG: Sec-independent protein translocase subunit TatA [Steroidobacteraceae bacterium]